MRGQQEVECLRATLVDANCDQEFIERFMKCQDKSNMEEALRMLFLHRKKLLDCMHESQARLDCLDYLIYELRRGM